MLPWTPAKTAISRLRFWAGVGVCTLGMWALSGQFYDWLRTGQLQETGQKNACRAAC